jgi:hypothetical protein
LERSLRQAIVIAVAAVLLVAAAVFGLLAAYHALVSLYQFSALEAAAIMAACLLLIGLIVVAILPLVGRQPKRASPTPLVARGDGAGLINQGVGKPCSRSVPCPWSPSLSSLGCW